MSTQEQSAAKDNSYSHKIQHETNKKRGSLDR